MILTVAKHVQVIHETPESMAAREENPRKRRRYTCSCTCKERRRDNGHCRHTLAIFAEYIRPTFWPYVTPGPMSSETGSTGFPERSRLDLERELVGLRRRVRELEKAP